MATYQIRHLTTYRYRQPVAFGEHRMMFRPRESHDQRTLAFALAISPAPARVIWSEDASGNLVGLATFDKRARELRFDATMDVDCLPFDLKTASLAPYAEGFPFSYEAEEVPDLARYIERQHPDRQHMVDRWMRSLMAEVMGRDAGGRTGERIEAARWGTVETWSFLNRVNDAIRRDFAYVRREEMGVQTPAATLRLRRGSCRDFAVLMTEALRSQGFAVRFVSGYLHVPKAGARARFAGGATHAWVQVYLPGAGWVDFDPTSGTVGNADLVRVAVVRDPAQASPLSGSFIGFPSDDAGMEVAVSVSRRAASEGLSPSHALEAQM